MNALPRRLSAIALTVVAAGAVSVSLAHSASAEGVGDLCRVTENTAVYSGIANNDRIYTVAKGDWFRIVGGPYTTVEAEHTYWRGHGEGHTDGYAINASRYVDCH